MGRHYDTHGASLYRYAVLLLGDPVGRTLNQSATQNRGDVGPTVRLSLLTAEGLFAVEGNDLLRVRLTGMNLELLFAGAPTPRVFARG